MGVLATGVYAVRHPLPVVRKRNWHSVCFYLFVYSGIPGDGTGSPTFRVGLPLMKMLTQTHLKTDLLREQWSPFANLMISSSITNTLREDSGRKLLFVYLPVSPGMQSRFLLNTEPFWGGGSPVKRPADLPGDTGSTSNTHTVAHDTWNANSRGSNTPFQSPWHQP